ncbi:MAG: hypothetical protein ABIO17_01105 [Pseudoxanthomonas sp.]
MTLEVLVLCVAVWVALAACKQGAADSTELEAPRAAAAVGSAATGVRNFDLTTSAAKSVTLTFASNVARGYKEVDAAPLLGP